MVLLVLDRAGQEEECVLVQRQAWRAGLAPLPTSPISSLWAYVLWDGDRQLLELPADWAEAWGALESCLFLLTTAQHPRCLLLFAYFSSPSCSFKA